VTDERLVVAIPIGLDAGELPRWLHRYRFHDPNLARAALVARVVGAVMQERRPRDYAAEYAARKAKHPGLSARAAAGHRTVPARRGATDLFRASPREAESRKRAREAVSLAREHGWSKTRAAREAHTTSDNMRRWAPSAFNEQGGVKAADTEVRIMPVVSAREVFPEVAIRGSRQAGIISAHLRAIGRYLATGDEEPLSHFRGVVVNGTLLDGRKVRLELETDTDVLDALGAEGSLTGLVVGS
jgi:hypothetical protein